MTLAFDGQSIPAISGGVWPNITVGNYKTYNASCSVNGTGYDGETANMTLTLADDAQGTNPQTIVFQGTFSGDTLTISDMNSDASFLAFLQSNTPKYVTFQVELPDGQVLFPSTTVNYQTIMTPSTAVSQDTFNTADFIYGTVDTGYANILIPGSTYTAGNVTATGVLQGVQTLVSPTPASPDRSENLTKGVMSLKSEKNKIEDVKSDNVEDQDELPEEAPTNLPAFSETPVTTPTDGGLSETTPAPYTVEKRRKVRSTKSNTVDLSQYVSLLVDNSDPNGSKFKLVFNYLPDIANAMAITIRAIITDSNDPSVNIPITWTIYKDELKLVTYEEPRTDIIATPEAGLGIKSFTTVGNSTDSMNTPDRSSCCMFITFAILAVKADTTTAFVKAYAFAGVTQSSGTDYWNYICKIDGSYGDFKTPTGRSVYTRLSFINSSQTSSLTGYKSDGIGITAYIDVASNVTSQVKSARVLGVFNPQPQGPNKEMYFVGDLDVILTLYWGNNGSRPITVTLTETSKSLLAISDRLKAKRETFNVRSYVNSPMDVRGDPKNSTFMIAGGKAVGLSDSDTTLNDHPATFVTTDGMSIVTVGTQQAPLKSRSCRTQNAIAGIRAQDVITASMQNCQEWFLLNSVSATQPIITYDGYDSQLLYSNYKFSITIT